MALEMYITKEKLHLLHHCHGHAMATLYAADSATLSVGQMVLLGTDMVLILSKPSSLDCWEWMTQLRLKLAISILILRHDQRQN